MTAQEGWSKAFLEDLKDSGEMLGEYYLAVTPDDTFGWGNLFQKMWFSDVHALPSGTGVLLTGPAGCGKHTAAAHLIRNLRARGYVLAVLPEDDPEGDGPNTPTQIRLNSLLDYWLEDLRKPLCLLAEDVSGRSRSRELFRFLGEMLCYYYLHRGEDSLQPGPKDRMASRKYRMTEDPVLPFFLILIENREAAVPGILRNRLQLCRMSPPDRAQREAFLGSTQHYVQYLSDARGLVSAEELLARTEGMTYAQLEDLVNALNTLYETNRGADAQAVRSLLDSQLPPGRSPGRLERLLRELPGALARLPVNAGGQGGGAVAPAQPVVARTKAEEPQMTNADYAAQFTKDSVYASASDLFGAEKVDAFIARNNLQVERS